MENENYMVQLGGLIYNEAQIAAKGNPMVVDFGVIGADMSLTTNSFPLPIPVGDWQVCRQLTLGAVDKVLYKTQKKGEPNDGSHDHNGDGCHGGHVAGDGCHSHSDDGEEHIHDYLICERMRSIKAGDRVLVVWVGNDAVVVDIIFPAKEAFTHNV